MASTVSKGNDRVRDRPRDPPYSCKHGLARMHDNGRTRPRATDAKASNTMQTCRVTYRSAAVVVLGLLWVVTAAFTCPEKCRCNSYKRVNCRGRWLEDVPANIPLDTTDLYLSSNSIQNLSDVDFANLTRLVVLGLSNNYIRVLPAGVFANLTSLEELSLSNNNISRLPAGVSSSHLTRLKRLDLSGNFIVDLSDGVFSNLTSLEWLSLSNNNISRLPAGVFSHLPRLKTLYLSNNHIVDLSDGVFSNLTSLVRLSLSNNNISRLPAGVFSHLTRLEWLYLDDNHIVDLSDGVFSNLTSLEWLSLSNNNISRLPAGVFSHLPRLKWLHLSYNHIVDLSDGVFLQMASLRQLYLDNNNISRLPADFSRLLFLQRLGIAGNPWRCDCSLQHVMSWVRTSRSDFITISGSPSCSSPPHMEGIELTDVTTDRVCNSRGDCTMENAEGTCVCNVVRTGQYCEEEVNVALRKNATQSPTDTVFHGAEKAVDGDYHECASIRWGELPPSWKVDLAGFYQVSRISVLSRAYRGKLLQQRR
ncbi:PREDICTED: carboxypeptidase N subunit 2-like [Branchiostoma belcheri]|uniref:Carboxypeptidase N subunit 2-like n=1 Tax=Branchiostoma belcheri TaxID=7741 RepID=A0A6P5A3Y8_BRABE|nr:PREDICTED: carboxypeptidase N subunit 2-like [Branchiostoma belcheri]